VRADIPRLPAARRGPVPAPLHAALRGAARGRRAAGAADADLRIWVRHKGGDDSGGVPNVAAEVALLALADMAPPAACSLFAAEAPVSSATWHINVLDAPDPEPYPGGWWLLRTRAEHAREGYSSQDMEVWGRGGPVAVGRQCVAIYA